METSGFIIYDDKEGGAFTVMVVVLGFSSTIGNLGFSSSVMIGF